MCIPYRNEFTPSTTVLVYVGNRQVAINRRTSEAPLELDAAVEKNENETQRRKRGEGRGHIHTSYTVPLPRLQTNTAPPKYHTDHQYRIIPHTTHNTQHQTHKSQPRYLPLIRKAVDDTDTDTDRNSHKRTETGTEEIKQRTQVNTQVRRGLIMKSGAQPVTACAIRRYLRRCVPMTLTRWIRPRLRLRLAPRC